MKSTAPLTSSSQLDALQRNVFKPFKKDPAKQVRALLCDSVLAHCAHARPCSSLYPCSGRGTHHQHLPPPVPFSLFLQARYEAFLRGRRQQVPGLSERDAAAELREFQQAARLYKPMTKVMAQRFQPATENFDDTLGEEEKAALAAGEAPAPEVKAARQKAFGSATRTVVEWHPHRLLCKRFGVPDPYPMVRLQAAVAESRRGSP